jgi:tetratricopeptide (TPR) repeat protein
MNGFPDPSRQLNQFMRDRSIARYLSQRDEHLLEGVKAVRPQNQAVRFLQGLARFRLKDFDAARELFASVLASDPLNADAAYYLGLSLEAQGRAIEAMVAFRKALAIRPGFAQAAAKLR